MTEVTLSEYQRLIHEFISGSVSAAEFERRYLDLFKSDDSIREENIFLVLDRLFSDVDVFCSDPAIRGKNDLDEQGLLDAAVKAHEQIQEELSKWRDENASIKSRHKD